MVPTLGGIGVHVNVNVNAEVNININVNTFIRLRLVHVVGLVLLNLLKPDFRLSLVFVLLLIHNVTLNITFALSLAFTFSDVRLRHSMRFRISIGRIDLHVRLRVK
jgi:hypothetical protein